MTLSAQNGERLSLEQMRAFLQASEEVQSEVSSGGKVYVWVSETLYRQEYWKQPRATEGLVRQYIVRMTGLSRAQVTRLVAQRNRFAPRYTAAGIELLAGVDEAHEALSGPATQKILYRESYEYGDARFARLATISVAHIYISRPADLLPEDAAWPGAACPRSAPAAGANSGGSIARTRRRGRSCGNCRTAPVTYPRNSPRTIWSGQPMHKVTRKPLVRCRSQRKLFAGFRYKSSA